ncbi:ribosomal protein L17, partial [Ostreococcus tauri]
RNLVIQLVARGEVETTLTRAKALKSAADWLVTVGKQSSLNSKRRMKRALLSENLVHKARLDIAARFIERNGGYTSLRVTRTRKGDAVTLAKVQFLH